MILAGSPLTLARVPLIEVYLRSNRQPEKLDDYFAYFHDTLLAGDDLAPVLLLRDETRRMYRLEDGRKRFAAHILAGRSEMLAVVMSAPPESLSAVVKAGVRDILAMEVP